MSHNTSHHKSHITFLILFRLNMSHLVCLLTLSQAYSLLRLSQAYSRLRLSHVCSLRSGNYCASWTELAQYYDKLKGMINSKMINSRGINSYFDKLRGEKLCGDKLSGWAFFAHLSGSKYIRNSMLYVLFDTQPVRLNKNARLRSVYWNVNFRNKSAK